jgi:hypothetical protein
MKKNVLIPFLCLLLIMPFTASVNAEEQTERVIITFNNEINYELMDKYHLEVHHIFEEVKAVSVTIPASQKDLLKNDPSIRFMEDDPVVKTVAQTPSWGYSTLNIPQSKSDGFTGEGVKIGIIDTGVKIGHPDLKIAGGVNFVTGASTYNDDQGHGTHVAGIIAALDNSYGAVGVAPDAQIYAIKSLNSSGEGNQSDVIAGVNWAIEQGMDIINLSLTATEGSYPLQTILQKAYDEGIIIVAASGNALTPSTDNSKVLFPARYSTVLAVGSVGKNLVRSDFSHYGSELDFVAPGAEIYSTYNGSTKQYTYSTGTSMAAPFVAGIAALYKEEYPAASNVELEALMRASALDLGAAGKDVEYGYGLIQPPTIESQGLFYDVKKDSWYSEEIEYLYTNGIVTGYNDGGFHPYDQVTRAEAVAMLGRAFGLSGVKTPTAFSDVSASSFASGYVSSATAAGIISGFKDGTFKPDANIIRGDVAVILQRAFEFPILEKSYFSDVSTAKHYYNAVNSLASQGISLGFTDGTFRPDLNITRAEFSVFLAKSLDESFR